MSQMEYNNIKTEGIGKKEPCWLRLTGFLFLFFQKVDEYPTESNQKTDFGNIIPYYNDHRGE